VPHCQRGVKIVHFLRNSPKYRRFLTVLQDGTENVMTKCYESFRDVPRRDDTFRVVCHIKRTLKLNYSIS
jgi:hypothetical protein